MTVFRGYPRLQGPTGSLREKAVGVGPELRVAGDHVRDALEIPPEPLLADPASVTQHG
jgi:hypothetical protein